MIIKECAYCSHETIIGTKAENPTCNLFPKEENQGKLSYRFEFVPCESIPIANCPYKLFMCGKINKEELNKRIMEIQKERNNNAKKNIHTKRTNN